MKNSASYANALSTLACLQGKKISLGQILDCIAGLGFSTTLLGLALLVIAVPVPKIPPLNILFTLPFVYLGWQMVTGQEPHLPRWLAEKEFERRKVKATAKKVYRLLNKMQNIAKKSMPSIVHFKYIDQTIGIIILILTVSMFLPIPFTTTFPAITIVMMALGQIHEDGRLIILGISLAIIWLIILILIVGEVTDEIADVIYYLYKRL